MDIIDFFSELAYSRKWKKAVKEINEIVGFDLFEKGIERSYDAKWYHEKPFVMILYLYKNGKMIRREFYEYVGNGWQYIGYMTKNMCLDFYWKMKGAQSRRETGKNMRNDNNEEQTNHIMELELKEYFQYYRQYVNRNRPPKDGAKVKQEYYKETSPDPKMDSIIDGILKDPDFFKF